MNNLAIEKKPSMRWGVERRMEFIEFRLLWEGGINRSDISEQFGVSAPQASNDLSQYKDRAPANIVYDLSQKRYFASDNFEPVFLSPDPDRYLSQLKLIADHLVTKEETWLSVIPSIDSVPIPHRRVEVPILKKLIAAVRNNRSLEVHYQSMSADKPDPVWRWITPLAFANDGMRWHVRVFCHVRKTYRDFILSRILDVKADGEPESSPDSDKCWHETVDVILVPNPALSKGQQSVIAYEYGMEGGKLHLPVRKAILYYLKKRLRLDVKALLDKPQEVPVVVENEEDFERALHEADGLMT